MNESRIESVIIGKNRRTTLCFLLLTTALVFVVLGLVAAQDVFGMTLTAVVPRGILVYLLPTVFIVATLNAYDNDGILVSWLIVFAPLFFAFVNYLGSVIPIGTDPTQIEWVLSSASAALVYAVVIGTVAFVLGAGGRRAINQLRT